MRLFIDKPNLQGQCQVCGIMYSSVITTVLLACTFCASCAANRSTTKSESTIPVPPFQIRVTLSDAAATKLRDAGEIIKGAVYFDGDGTPKYHEETAPFRAVILGVYQFETREAGIISISNAVISEEAFERLSDSNYYFTINVFSGRRAFKDNILDDGYAQGHIRDTINAPIEVFCDLIKK